ncbi:MAG: hypothetical protein L0220_13475 [Acidobacteria bacterium]|nr:hypothetical protein [Acidobacteriota bacterium]
MTTLSEDPQFAQRYAAYQAAANGRTISLKPGDKIALKSTAGRAPIELLCMAANAEVIDRKPNANPECVSATPQNEDTSENGRSVALLLGWGEFEFLNLADLTWPISQRLVCPDNHIGEIDLYQVTHHGGNVSNNPRLLRSIQPTVAVMINGPRKGGHPETVKWLRETSSLQALYQLHRNIQTTLEQNAPPEFIANLEEQPDTANMISVSVDTANSAFIVSNGRTNERKSYRIK